MLSKKRTWAGVLVLALAVGVPGFVARAEEFRTIQAKDLVKKPQQYWAQGFVFKDTMATAPTGKSKKLGERNATAFSTKIAGECWADEALVPALKDLKPGAEALFTATVFQQHGWFSDKYFIVIQQVTASGTQLATMGPSLAALQAQDSNLVYAVTARRFGDLQTEIQAELIAYAAEKNVTMRDLFAPGSEHRDRVFQAIHGALSKLEQETRQPASTFLIDVIAATMAQPLLDVPPAMPATTNAVTTNEIEKIVVQKADEKTPAVTPSAGTTNEPSVTVATNAPSSVNKEATPKRRSFFARLFGIGSGPKKPKEAKPAAEKTTPPPAAEAVPADKPAK